MTLNKLKFKDEIYKIGRVEGWIMTLTFNQIIWDERKGEGKKKNYYPMFISNPLDLEHKNIFVTCCARNSRC